jgi:hypothetical protein
MSDSTEMKSLVEKLAKERKQHLDHIENMSFKDLKQMVSRHALLIRLRAAKEELRAPPALQGRARSRMQGQEVLERLRQPEQLLLGSSIHEAQISLLLGDFAS